jgi:hypothetical protein
MEHVFPEDNPLLKQKTFMHNHMFSYLSDRTISEFCAWWIKLNNYLNGMTYPSIQDSQFQLWGQVQYAPS